MYNFDEAVERRGTQCAKWDRIEKDLLPMWIADMDFPAPPAVLKALSARVEHGVLGYGDDGEDLPKIICAWLQDEFKISVDENWLVLLPAIIPSYMVACNIRQGPIMINIPIYNGILHATSKVGKKAIFSPLKNINEYYEMDYDDMRKRLVPELQLFCLCNPHNPVGRVYTKEELLELSRFARKNKLLVISDDVHCGLTLDRPYIPYFSVDDYALQQSITLIGTAKTFNLPGLPCGFAIIPNETLREEFKEISYALPSPGILEVIAAKAAFGESREWRLALVDYLRGSRDYLEASLRRVFPGAKLPHVEGTYLQWVDFRPLGIEQPWQWLQDKAKVLASDGKSFGAEGYVRFNFGTSRGRLEDAVQRMERGVQRF
jgi:cystathionine beta-lyase